MAEPAVQFMLELAAALNRAGEPVALNQASMERVAAAYGVADARVAVLPDVVLAAGGRGTPTALDFAHFDSTGHRLDRTAAIAALAARPSAARSTPRRVCGGWTRSTRCGTASAPLGRDRRLHGADHRPGPDPAADPAGTRAWRPCSGR